MVTSDTDACTSSDSERSNLVMSEEDRIAELQQEFPDAAAAEMLRFCKARPNSTEAAAEMYRAHLEWRKGEGSKENLLQASRAIPPKYIRRAGRAIDGTPILIVQGALYDPDIKPETYVLACAHLLDSTLSPEEDTKMTLLIDTRPGEGPDWHNAPAHSMLPFFREVIRVMAANFPERAQRVVVYPVPWIVKGLWKVVSSFLDPVTRNKFQVLSGSSDIDSPCPAELRDVVNLDELPHDMQKRHAALHK